MAVGVLHRVRGGLGVAVVGQAVAAERAVDVRPASVRVRDGFCRAGDEAAKAGSGAAYGCVTGGAGVP